MNVDFICSSVLRSFCLLRGTLLAALATRVVGLVALDRGCLRQKSGREK